MYMNIPIRIAISNKQATNTAIVARIAHFFETGHFVEIYIH